MKMVGQGLSLLLLVGGGTLMVYLPIQAVLWVQRTTGVVLNGRGFVWDESLGATLFGLVLVAELVVIAFAWAWVSAAMKRRAAARPAQPASTSVQERLESSLAAARSVKQG